MIKKINLFVERYPYYILCGIVILGFILRLVNLRDNFIFAYDQSRDAQRIMEMAKGHLKIVGPETDIPGVFNGPLLYYLFLPFYFVSHFDPNLVAVFIVIVNTLTTVLVFYTAKILFNNKKIALIAAFLWSISYLQMNYARYISNASFMTIASTLFFLGLALFFLKGKKTGLILGVVGYATAIHFNFYLVYLGLFFPLFILLYKKHVTRRQILTHIILLLVMLSPFILAEYKWNFMMSKSLLNYFLHQANSYSSHTTFITTVADNFIRYYGKLDEAIHESFFAFNSLIGFFLFLTGLLFIYKKEVKRSGVMFLLIWLFSTAPLFLFKSGVLSVSVINTTIFVPLTIVFAFLVYHLFSYRFVPALLCLIVICLSNFILWYQSGFVAVKHFVSDPMLYGDEKRIIDYTYTAAHNKPFSICSISVPLFINSNWSFLYDTYGKRKYGFVPAWAGQIQTQSISLLPNDVKHEKQRFLIVEPKKGMPEAALKTTIYLEDQVSALIQEKRFGGMVVQNRFIPNDITLLKDTQHLTDADSKLIEYTKSMEARYHCSIEY